MNNWTQQSFILRELGISSKHLDPDLCLSMEERKSANGNHPKVAFIVPVHNMQGVIARNLRSIISQAHQEFEIVVMLDDCTDDSRHQVFAAFAEMEEVATASRFVVIESAVPLFETACDAIGIAVTSAPFIIEVQADMQLKEIGWDESMVRVLEDYPDVFSVSGRGCHLWLNEMPSLRETRGLSSLRRQIARYLQRGLQEIGWADHTKFTFKNADFFGRCGLLIECRVPKRAKKHIYLSETVMRGPWAFSREKYEALDGLDTERFFLGHDDHDLSYRAWSKFGWRSAYLPIDFASPLVEGATRHEKSSEQVLAMETLAAMYAADSETTPNRHENLVRPVREIRPSMKTREN